MCAKIASNISVGLARLRQQTFGTLGISRTSNRGTHATLLSQLMDAMPKTTERNCKRLCHMSSRNREPTAVPQSSETHRYVHGDRPGHRRLNHHSFRARSASDRGPSPRSSDAWLRFIWMPQLFLKKVLSLHQPQTRTWRVRRASSCWD